MNQIRLAYAVVMSAFSLHALGQDLTKPVNTTAQLTALPLEYRSAFEGNRAYQESALRSWRDSNDEAGLLGGHGGQLKPRPMPPSSMTPAGTAGEPAVPSPAARSSGEPGAPAQSPLTPPKPASTGHEGHPK